MITIFNGLTFQSAYFKKAAIICREPPKSILNYIFILSSGPLVKPKFGIILQGKSIKTSIRKDQGEFMENLLKEYYFKRNIVFQSGFICSQHNKNPIVCEYKRVWWRQLGCSWVGTISHLIPAGFKVYIRGYDVNTDTFYYGNAHQWTLSYEVVVDE